MGDRLPDDGRAAQDKRIASSPSYTNGSHPCCGCRDRGVPETAEIECPIEVDTASYFVSTIERRRGGAPTMAQWRKRLFLATSAITADAAEYFNLPRDRTLIVGSHVEV